ncbi:MAG: MAPEG family protein [Alphaproteobacteria bacterium]
MVGELQLLATAIAIGLVHLLWAAAAARKQQSLLWAGGSRDEARPVTGVAARLDRAFKNFRETFPFFAAAVLAAYLTGKTGGGLCMWGSVLYVAGRAAYLPLYASGVRYWRSLVWSVSFLGLVMVLVSLAL